MPSYSQYVDPQNIAANVGGDYVSAAKLVASGLTSLQGAPTPGSQMEWVKTTLWSGNDEGQTLVIGGEIDLQEKEQVSYAMPIVTRADGAIIDSLAKRIINRAPELRLSYDEVQERVEAGLTVEVNTQAMQMFDSMLAKVISGCGEYLASNTINYANKGGNQFTPDYIPEVLAQLGDAGETFTDNQGFIVCKGDMKQKMLDLGVVAYTSNTLGQAKQDQIINSGVLGTVFGMTVIASDKVDEFDANDQYIYLIKRGALRAFNSPVDIRPIQEKERGFQEIIKFQWFGGAIIDGLSWGTSKADGVSNTDLATGTNYETAANNTKNIGMAVIRVDDPTF